MGRYYFGSIKGKFWFAIQSSGDATNFKNPINFPGPIRCYDYSQCCCFVEDFDKLYCNECYSSYEEHYNNIDDDCKDYYYDDALIQENNYVKYIFKKYELKYINKILNELEEQIGSELIEYINFTFDTNSSDTNSSDDEDDEDEENNTDDKEEINNSDDDKEDNNYFEYSINNNIFKADEEEKYKDKFELIARWCLGRQIKECVEKNDICEIFCEL